MSTGRNDDARAALKRAIVDVEQLDAPSPARDRETIQAAWRGLVSGEWRLVDHFDANGKKYVIATVSAETPPARPASMSEREHEVIARAARGATNKEIAADLGVAQSTVRVLLHRAALKLGVTHRDEAIARFRELSDL